MTRSTNASAPSASSTASNDKDERQYDITAEELQRLQKAFKNEEFRNLFSDYVKEISDPKNKELYEQEIAALEAERGNSIRWVKPTPWKVIKTQYVRPPDPVDVDKSIHKVFINVGNSEEIATGKSTKIKKDGKVGESWSIPYSLSSPRVDTDHAQNQCMVYDCVFNPRMTEKGTQIPAFADILFQTAVEGIERQFEGVKLSREWKILKLKYKGEPKSTVIRSKAAGKKPKGGSSLEFLEKIQSQMPGAPNFPANPQASKAPTAVTGKTNLIEEISSSSAHNRPLPTPDFSIVHRGMLTYQAFTNTREKNLGARPELLVVRIQLPLVASAAELEVDTTDKEVVLAVPKKYSDVRIGLPFPVVYAKATAKFCKKKRELEIEVPVVPPEPGQMVSINTYLFYFASIKLILFTKPPSDAPIENDEDVDEPAETAPAPEDEPVEAAPAQEREPDKTTPAQEREPDKTTPAQEDELTETPQSQEGETADTVPAQVELLPDANREKTWDEQDPLKDSVECDSTEIAVPVEKTYLP
ncbi:Protein kintoun [Dinochytrium kinnereticum]|nr:Protein kintoun [Dinochytrium kinnereticum]